MTYLSRALLAKEVQITMSCSLYKGVVFHSVSFVFWHCSIHTSLLIPALKHSKCVLREDTPILLISFGFVWRGLLFFFFFEERIFTEKCSKIFIVHLAVFTDLLILRILLRKVASWDRAWKK